MNAVIDGMGAIVLVLLEQMEPEQRERAAKGFARLAAVAEAEGNITLETLLISMNKAAQIANRPAKP